LGNGRVRAAVPYRRKQTGRTENWPGRREINLIPDTRARNDRARESEKKKARRYAGWGTERERERERGGDARKGAKKNLSKTGPGPLPRGASPACPRTRRLSNYLCFFPPPRFFALQQIKRNPHPWGTLLDYSLFSSCFHGSPFAFPPIAGGRSGGGGGGGGYAWQIAFLVPCTRCAVSFPRKKWEKRGGGGRGGKGKGKRKNFFRQHSQNFAS